MNFPVALLFPLGAGTYQRIAESPWRGSAGRAVSTKRIFGNRRAHADNGSSPNNALLLTL